MRVVWLAIIKVLEYIWGICCYRCKGLGAGKGLACRCIVGRWPVGEDRRVRARKAGLGQ